MDRRSPTAQSGRHGYCHRPCFATQHMTKGRCRKSLPERRTSGEKKRVMDIRIAHGRLRRPTVNLAVLRIEVESSHAAIGGGMLTSRKKPPRVVATPSADT
ncbi:hypothetical protein EVAR_34842_1 [Eumeta japonica]|uniref:Uncharacterized protein n=1 Tax=Eumeta variegata TaxID=151549 RepID=A0A4C1YZ93_EUMVA|nr:hypothetical protein EVAR_34842_1 [Eumeta japonica]